MASHAEHDPVPTQPPASADRLQPVPHLDRTAITVSGLSSGGFFAHQFHVAHSSLVSGAGIMAGGPYGCVEHIPNPYWPFWSMPMDRVSAAVVACTHYFGGRYYGLRPAAPKAEDSIRLIRQAWEQRLIDDPANLRDDRVWLFRGRLDEVVPDPVAQTLTQVYRSLGVVEPQLLADDNKPGQSVTERAVNHGLPVARFTGQSRFPVRECNQHEPPFVIQCGFDAAGALLRHLHSEGFTEASDDPHRDGTLLAFDQTEFGAGEGAGSLHRVGYIYVPHRCAEVACRLHVAFHGCKQTVDSVHDDFIRDGGYNRWAASHRIVVLYPQATASAANPNACWDFWGYSGLNYANRNGPQVRATRAMVDRLLGRQP
ncbi:MAG TPA: hypothetical protein VHG30_05285 [Microvirga sp.]|nr:hypothetical protein [Microvirga sp.]